MDLFTEHIKQCGLDNELLEEFIELYKLTTEVDPNRINAGVDIFRNFEYAYPLKWLRSIVDEKTKILDLGSSSTIWPVLMYKVFGCTVFATDIDTDSLEIQNHYLYHSGYSGEKCIVERQDMTNITHGGNIFDVVCAISAIEHIPGDGDIKCISEVERVLKPGGSFILTTSFSSVFTETETEHYHFSYEKRYDYQSIKDRLVGNFKIKNMKFLNNKHENGDAISNFWYANKLYNNLGKLSMLFSLSLYEISDEPNQNTRGFIGMFQK